MKIALPVSSFLPRIGGAEVVVHNLAIHLRRLGHDAQVVTWWGLWRDVRGRLPYPMRPLLPGSYTAKSRQAWQEGRGQSAWVGLQTAFWQRLLRFDVWNIHLAHPLAFLMQPTLQRLKVPLVTTCHGDDILIMPEIGSDIRLNPHLDAALAKAYAGSAAVTAISASIHQAFAGLGLPEGKICDIPNGVDVERIQARASRRDAVRQHWGLGPDEPLLISVGRDHPAKNYELVPRIAAALKRAGHAFRWFVVGAGTARVQKLAEEAGLGALVQAIPAIPPSGAAFDMPPDGVIDLYHAADVFVMTSLMEGLPMVLIEAMAAGLPVVATRVPGCTDLVRDGEQGFLVDPQDAEDGAARLGQLLQDRAVRQAMSVRSRQESARYAWPRVAARYVACYEQVLAARRKA